MVVVIELEVHYWGLEKTLWYTDYLVTRPWCSDIMIKLQISHFIRKPNEKRESFLEGSCCNDAE